MRRLLKSKGIEALEAENGAEALVLFEDQEIDFVLMDLQMPVMDGYQATVELRQRDFKQPIIAVTAASEVESLHLTEKGFDAYFAKPVNFLELYNLLKRYLVEDETSSVQVP